MKAFVCTMVNGTVEKKTFESEKEHCPHCLTIRIAEAKKGECQDFGDACCCIHSTEYYRLEYEKE